MATKLIGQNYTTPDLVAKVTGKAKYAEDYRVDGMLFCKLLSSPMPHARVKRLDTSRALARPGGANARTQGNIWIRPPAPPAPARGAAPGSGDARGGAGARGRGGAAGPPAPQIAVWKWTDEDFRNAKDGELPLGKFSDEWLFG